MGKNTTYQLGLIRRAVLEMKEEKRKLNMASE
jgi:hypothetical protein